MQKRRGPQTQPSRQSSKEAQILKPTPPSHPLPASASQRVRWGSWAGWGWEPRGWTLRPLLPPRYFHRPADGSEVMYDAVSIMNADILNYCQKESWCKLAF